jgi:drug/metabolite transporter (DMT)-like permease
MPRSAPHTPWAVAALLLNALVWGLSWWPFKRLEALGLHPLWATAVVYGLSFVLIWLGCRWRGVPAGAWRAHPGLWWLLIASGLTNVGFNWAVTTGDVVRVVLLFYLMPAWSVLVAWWLLGERPTTGALLRLLLALAGLAVVLHTPGQPWPVPESPADVLALLGGLSFALTNALLLRLRLTPESARMLAMFGGGTVMAILTALLGSAHAVVQSTLWHPGWGLPVLALTLAFLGGNLALQYGAARLPAHTTALVMLSEVVFASVSSVMLGASHWDRRSLLGGALILLAAVLSVMQPGPLNPNPSQEKT